MFDFGPETRACYRESALELHDSVKLPVDTCAGTVRWKRLVKGDY